MCNNDYLILSINQNRYAINSKFIETILELPTRNLNITKCDNGISIFQLGGIDISIIELDGFTTRNLSVSKFVYILIVNIGGIKFALQCDNCIEPNKNQLAKQKQQAYIFSELLFDSTNPVQKFEKEQLLDLYIKHELPNRIAI